MEVSACKGEEEREGWGFKGTSEVKWSHVNGTKSETTQKRTVSQRNVHDGLVTAELRMHVD